MAPRSTVPRKMHERHWRAARRSPRSRGTHAAHGRNAARAGRGAIEQASAFQASVERSAQRTADADFTIHDAATRLVQHLTQVESAGAAAAARHEAGEATNAGIDALLIAPPSRCRRSAAGIDLQAASVSRCSTRRRPGSAAPGSKSEAQSAGRLDGAGYALDGLSARIAEQERASQRLIADLDLGLVALDERFARLAQQGDERASAFRDWSAGSAATSTRSATIPGAGPGDPRAGRSYRGAARRCRVAVAGRSAELGSAFGDAEAGATRLEASEQARPVDRVDAMRAAETSERLASGSRRSKRSRRASARCSPRSTAARSRPSRD